MCSNFVHRAVSHPAGIFSGLILDYRKFKPKFFLQVNTSPQQKLSATASKQKTIAISNPVEPYKLKTFGTKTTEYPISDDYPDYILQDKLKKKNNKLKKAINIIIESQKIDRNKDQLKYSKQQEEFDDDDDSDKDKYPVTEKYTEFNKTDLYRLVNSYMHAVNDLDNAQKLFTDLPKSDSLYSTLVGEAQNIADELKLNHEDKMNKTDYLVKLNKLIAVRDELTTKFFPFPFPFDSNIVHNFAIDVIHSLILTTPTNDTERVNAFIEKYRAFEDVERLVDMEKTTTEAMNETTLAPTTKDAAFGGLDLGSMVGGFLGGFSPQNDAKNQDGRRHRRSVENLPDEADIKRETTDSPFKDTKSYELLEKYFESRLEMNRLTSEINKKYGLDLPNADAHPNDVIIKALREIQFFLDFNWNQALDKSDKISFRGVSDFRLKDLLRAYNHKAEKTNSIYTEMKKTMFLFFQSHNDPLYDSVHTRYWIHSLSDEMGLRSNQPEGMWDASAPHWVPNHNTVYEKLDIQEKNLWKEFMWKFGDEFYVEDFTSLDYKLVAQTEQLLESVGMQTYKKKFPGRFAMLSKHEGIMQQMQNLFNYLRGNVPSLGLYHDEVAHMGSSLQQFKRTKPCAIENIMKFFQLPVKYANTPGYGPLSEQKLICDNGTLSGLYIVYKNYLQL
jgi:hypothetical protein